MQAYTLEQPAHSPTAGYADPTVYVVDFGADPTGVQDSTQVRSCLVYISHD